MYLKSLPWSEGHLEEGRRRHFHDATTGFKDRRPMKIPGNDQDRLLRLLYPLQHLRARRSRPVRAVTRYEALIHSDISARPQQGQSHETC